jgi:hypothetical protein
MRFGGKHKHSSAPMLERLSISELLLLSSLDQMRHLTSESVI